MEILDLEEATGLLILDETGHSRMQWDKHNPEQVAAARARFDEFKAKGYMAYRVNKGGGQDEVLHSFDPDAEQIIMNRRMVGG